MWSRECGGRAGLFVVDEIIISLARMMINRRKMSRNDEDSRNSSDSVRAVPVQPDNFLYNLK